MERCDPCEYGRITFLATTVTSKANDSYMSPILCQGTPRVSYNLSAIKQM